MFAIINSLKVVYSYTLLELNFAEQIFAEQIFAIEGAKIVNFRGIYFRD